MLLLDWHQSHSLIEPYRRSRIERNELHHSTSMLLNWETIGDAMEK